MAESASPTLRLAMNHKYLKALIAAGGKVNGCLAPWVNRLYINQEALICSPKIDFSTNSEMIWPIRI
jgi:hypothetical protein